MNSPADSEARTSPRRTETAVALLLCAAVFLGPLVYIQGEYDAFTATYGEAREGAATAGLALAVVFRTVSRTVLRTVIRTSARAGMRASLKSVLRSGARVALRGNSAGIVKRITDLIPDDPGPGSGDDSVSISAQNLRSLLFASALLYASWVIVVGLGQPYTALLNREQSLAAEEVARAAEEAELAEMYEKGRIAWEMEQEVLRLQQEYLDLRVARKAERDINEQDRLQDEVNSKLLELNAAQFESEQAFEAAGERRIAPDELTLQQELSRFPQMTALKDVLFTYAPYPGETRWRSPVIWLGGLAMVIPLWFIYAVQLAVARQRGAVLRHETGVDGGFIQLYFAGAFSFMPLTSDVILDETGDAEQGPR